MFIFFFLEICSIFIGDSHRLYTLQRNSILISFFLNSQVSIAMAMHGFIKTIDITKHISCKIALGEYCWFSLSTMDESEGELSPFDIISLEAIFYILQFCTLFPFSIFFLFPTTVHLHSLHLFILHFKTAIICCAVRWSYQWKLALEVICEKFRKKEQSIIKWVIKHVL